jgi:hypothetical protein
MALPIKIEHRIGVQTPPEVIWEMIADIAGWPAWNPLYPKASGQLAFGAQLELEVAIPGEKPRRIRATVTDWTPNEQIIWKVSMFGGLLTTTRYIEIEKLSEEGCIFSNGEFFEGPLIRLLGRRQRKAIREGFARFGEAVRERAEAAWRSKAEAAT